MLETIRDYALEHLRDRPDHDDLRRRHAEYFAESAPDAMMTRFFVRGRPTLDFQRLGADTDNLRAALSWAAESRSQHELRLATSTNSRRESGRPKGGASSPMRSRARRRPT